MAELTNFPFSEIWAFGCWELWCLPLQSSQRLPSFTLCLIICFSGSGETSNICFKTLLARHCLPRLMCFITNSIIQWPQNLKVLLWQASICGTAPRGTWSHSFHRERSLEIHSVNLVRVPLREQSTAPSRRVKATRLLFPACLLSLSLWCINNKIPCKQVQLSSVLLADSLTPRA